MATRRRFLLLACCLIPARGSRANEDPIRDDFEDVIKPWLVAVRKGDAATLGSLTTLPFTYATTAKDGTCTGAMPTAGDLMSWAACLRKTQEQLFSKIDTGADVAIKTGGWGESKQFKALAKKISATGLWVQAYLQNGRGLSASFRFLISEGPKDVRKVKAFVLAVEPEKHK